MANNQAGQERTLSKVWIVLAVILFLFVIAYFLDKIIAVAIPTYSGFFSVLKTFISGARTP